MGKIEIRGVVEGFYGRPWSWEERSHLMAFMGENDYNLYIYGPKADPYHRGKWRLPYPKNCMDEFEKIIKKGRENSVEVSIAVSPGLSLSYTSEDDFNELLSKFLSFAKIGSRTFSLFLDDIPPELSHEEDRLKFDTLAEAQSFFVNKLYDALNSEIGDVNFIFCPTNYHGTSVTDYHKIIGEKIDGRIRIMWTGPEVCSEKISKDDACMISEAFRRPVLYWDNYPVNDATMVPELHMGPYEGRDPEISDHCCGVVLNPMNQYYANLIPLSAISSFLVDSDGITPEEATRKAIEKIAGKCSEAMLHFILSNIKSPIHKGYSKFIENVKDKSSALYGEGKYEESVGLIMKNGMMVIENSRSLYENLDERILNDIRPWIEEYELWGKIICAIAEVRASDLAFYRENPYEDKMPERLVENAAEAGRRLEELVAASTANRKDVFGNGGWEFAMETLKTNKGLIELFRF